MTKATNAEIGRRNIFIPLNWIENAESDFTTKDEPDQLEYVPVEAFNAQSALIKELVEVLEPFARLLGDAPLDEVGGGTLVAPEIKVQMVKDARTALAKAKEREP